ncbi:EscF/YscF/HrpA family type III secretion system needle major subunit [Candidatus Regiella insecticola]|uniref:Type III secretion system needle protein n=1 Tax=Candidatus Regiella insecticola TaxID=138073 RepID=A0A6L2ZM69_9ENTR|nr:EscF/YscF/HrpA family type III secretion system needle major subunit [Candidatus Regiella insecticola]GFN45298.1 type III secretion system needle protein [Candidatus Regiella insecticola]
MADLNHVVAGLLNRNDTSIEQWQRKIAETNPSDPQAQIQVQDYSRKMVAITEFTSSIIKMLRDLVRSIISKISA